MNKYLPEPPTNVRAVVNGVEVPMTVSYLGPGEHGEHVWCAQWPEGFTVPTWGDFTGLRCDALPARTSLVTNVASEADPFPDWMQPRSEA